MTDIDTARVIQRTLAGFDVQATVTDTQHGPAVTRYVLELGPGTPAAKVTARSEDLSLALGVEHVRLTSNGQLALEVPADERQTVTLDDLQADLEQDHPLRFPVGMNVAGQGVSARLDHTPHLLVAGATGSGKSVAVTSILAHLVERNAPATLRLALIDPKRVELSMFAGLPHLYAPVATEVEDAIALLEDALAEMEDRYRTMEDAEVRSIAELPEHARPPYLVVVIDEMADIMLTGKKRAETAIVRLLALGRAAGVHLVMATQRPSADVITGLIKANAPTRLVFSVQSHTDSGVALGQSGAERLTGMGDALWWPGGARSPLRVQSPFLDTADLQGRIRRVVADRGRAERDERVKNDVFDRLRAHRERHDAEATEAVPEPEAEPAPLPEAAYHSPEPEPAPVPEPVEDIWGTHAAPEAPAIPPAPPTITDLEHAYSKGRADEATVTRSGGARPRLRSDIWAAIGIGLAVLLVSTLLIPASPIALAVVAGAWTVNRRRTAYARLVSRMERAA